MSERVAQWQALRVEESAPRRAPSLAEQTYDALKLWIIDGSLEPSTVLSENDLARRFSISRSPLREAIRRLQDEGLLDASGPRGFSVPALSVDLVAQVYGVRRALETAAAETARNIPAAALSAMRTKMDMIGEALRRGDVGLFNETDFEFHDLWVLNCGNPLLITHLLRLRGHIQRIINFAGQFQNHTELAFAEHYVILDAMDSGDNVALRRAVDIHISSVTERLIEKLEQSA